MTIKRFWLLGLVLVAAMLLAPLAVAALPPALPAPSIISLRMSDTPDGPAKEQFPQGIGQVFAIVEYADMQDTPVLLKTYDGRGNVLVSETRTLSGEGQVALSIPVVFGSGGFLTNIYIQIEAPLYSQTGGFLATSAEWTVGSGELAEAAAPSSSEQPEPPASSLASPAVLAQPEVPEHLPFGPPSTEAQEPYPLPGRILVTLKRDVPFEALANEHARLRTEVVRRWPLQHAVRVRVPEGQEDKFIEIYKKKPNVLRATRVWAGAVQHGEPNDEYWAWHGQWPKRRMHLPEIWDYEPGSANTVVAVFDFSFYLEHQDVNYWSNPDEIPDNGLDDDNNGFVDDIVGWDFCNQPECEGPGDNDPGLESGETGYNHGVAMAGVCCSHTNNVEGVAGTGFYGPQAMLVKVGFYDESIGGYWATDDALAEGLHYATDNEAVAASLSISVGGYCDVIGPAAQYAWDHGLFMVGAAGNEVPYGNKDCGEWGIRPPAKCEPVKCIGGLETDDEAYGCRGPEKDFVAPGSSWEGEPIWAYDMAPAYWPEYPSIEYWYPGGTSQATQEFVGLAAKLKERGLTNQQVFDTLKNYSEDLGSPGWDEDFGWGFPLLYDYFAPTSWDWVTGIQVMNLHDWKKAKVKVYFHDSDGYVRTSLVDWIDPNRAHTFYLPAVSGLPDNWIGYAEIVTLNWDGYDPSFRAPIGVMMNNTSEQQGAATTPPLYHEDDPSGLRPYKTTGYGELWAPLMYKNYYVSRSYTTKLTLSSKARVIHLGSTSATMYAEWYDAVTGYLYYTSSRTIDPGFMYSLEPAWSGIRYTLRIYTSPAVELAGIVETQGRTQIDSDPATYSSYRMLSPGAKPASADYDWIVPFWSAKRGSEWEEHAGYSYADFEGRRTTIAVTNISGTQTTDVQLEFYAYTDDGTQELVDTKTIYSLGPRRTYLYQIPFSGNFRNKRGFCIVKLTNSNAEGVAMALVEDILTFRDAGLSGKFEWTSSGSKDVVHFPMHFENWYGGQGWLTIFYAGDTGAWNSQRVYRTRTAKMSSMAQPKTTRISLGISSMRICQSPDSTTSSPTASRMTCSGAYPITVGEPPRSSTRAYPSILQTRLATLVSGYGGSLVSESTTRASGNRNSRWHTLIADS